MPQHPNRLSGEGLFLLLGLGFGWGLNWPIMKYIIAGVPPLTFRGFCLFLGGLGILGIARYTKQPIKIPKGYLTKTFIICLLNIVAWNVMATYGLALLPAGRAALLGYTMPIWAVLLSVWVLGDSFNWRVAIALSLGMIGILLLMSESLINWFSAPLSISLLIGALLMLAAAWCWAIGTILMKRWSVPLNSVALTGWLLFLASIPILISAYFIDGIPQTLPSTLRLWGVVYNVFIGFMFCYWAWVKLVTLVPVSVSSLSSLITPMIGVISSIFLLGERPGVMDWSAALLILSAVAVINFGTKKNRGIAI
ncbi:MAG: EamA family transporter [Pseudomonadota bacterium]